MASVPELVAKAAEMNYSFLTLTDHGNMSGSVQLYEAGKEHGLKVFPGVEIYLLDPEYEGDLEKSGTAKRYHSCLAARNLDGYKALVKYVSLTHTRPRFSRFPRGLFSDLAELGQNSGDGVIYTTGCVFGLLQQTLLSKGEREATKFVSTMAKWFPHFFVELQNHNNVQEDGTTDDQIVEALAGIASKLGLPVIATPDTHYLNSMDADCHSLLKRMVYGNAEDAFPGGPYHLPSEEWVAEHYSPAIWDRVLEGADHYASLHDLVMPPLDKYKAQVPMMKKDPIKALRNRCLVVIDEQLADKKLKGGTRDDYVARLDHELSVIAKVGQGNYFLFMDRIIKQMRREGVFMDARGSASGSLVCYLLGITQVDPLFWGTDWDRFMGADRIQPPDIDMDIEDTSRWRVLAYLAENFDTMQIGTFSALGAYIDAEGNERGSIFQTYKTYIRSQVEGFAWDEEQILAAKENRKPVKGRALDAAKKKWFSIYEPNLKSLADAKYLDKKDHKLLQKMANMTLHKSYGVHAAGVLVSGAEMKIEDWVPSMLVPSSSTSVSQYTMKDVEKLGFMKGDWLGQTSLTVMRHCQELIGRDDPTDFTWIPFDDSATMKTCREFRQDTGIFHLEGYTKGRGANRMGVRNVRELVQVQALFMPGAMDSGATELFLKRHKSLRERKAVRYSHRLLKDVLGPTHGCLIYQEQVLSLARGVGITGNDLQDFFKVIKKSGAVTPENKAKMAHAKQVFFGKAREFGLSKAATTEAWTQIESMGGYGFNYSHAVAYGIRTYRTAYLKTHYPLEYMTALLTAWQGRPKENAYVKEARRIGIKILPAVVNLSERGWTMDKRGKAIRKGLVSIPGVGLTAAEEIEANAPYKDIQDFCQRVNPRKITGVKDWLSSKTFKGLLLKLHEAGALDELYTPSQPPF